MYRIKAKFSRFTEVSLYECVGTIGVYVVWDAKSYKNCIPTYIGKGNLFNRLESHHSKFQPPLDGYVSVLGDVGDRKADHDAELLEGMLLWIADKKRRLSKKNRQGARLKKLKNKLKQHRLVRCNLSRSGDDPFCSPRVPHKISEDKKYIRVFIDTDGELQMEHGWRKLRGSS